jgi:thioredoxin-related protein
MVLFFSYPRLRRWPRSSSVKEECTMLSNSFWSRILIVGTGIFFFAAPAARADGVPWRYDYDRALRESRRTGRPLLVHVGTRHCVWCRRMEASTLCDPDVSQLLADRFIPLKIDAEAEQELAHDFGVRSYPTLFLVSPHREILETQEGFVSAPRFLDQLNQALDQTTRDDSEE